MAERFQRLFSLPSESYKEGCPVAIMAGALQKDTVTGKILAQIKMRNIGADVIKSCKILLTSYDNYGKQVEEVTSFSYLDLDAKPGEEFGSKTPVFLPFDATRSFSVEVIETVLEDNSVNHYEQSGWNPIPEKKKIEDYLKDSELIKQFKLETGEENNYLPEKNGGLFLCSCGEINLDTNTQCNRCGKGYDELKNILDIGTLKGNQEQRLQKEQELQLEQEKKAATNKKKAIVAGIAVLLAIIAIVIFISANDIEKKFYTGVMPGMSTSDYYNYMEKNGYGSYGWNVLSDKTEFEYFGSKTDSLFLEVSNDQITSVRSGSIPLSRSEAEKVRDYLKSKSSSEYCEYDDSSGFKYSYSIKGKKYRIQINYLYGDVTYTIMR